MKSPIDAPLSEAETVHRREVALKRMLSTPPTPHNTNTNTKVRRATKARATKPKAS